MAKKRNKESILDIIPKRYVRYDEGAVLYSISENTFKQAARAAGACYKIGQVVLVNCDEFEAYVEKFKMDPVVNPEERR